MLKFPAQGHDVVSNFDFSNSAAHCIQRKNSETELLPHQVIVRLGAYNLTKATERGVVERNVSAIFVHPDWDPFSDSFDVDITILILSSNITFTDDIQPVCMPANGVAENMAGSVVGYGVRRGTVSAEIPKRIIVNVLNSSHCFREDDTLRTHSSERTFCGGMTPLTTMFVDVRGAVEWNLGDQMVRLKMKNCS